MRQMLINFPEDISKELKIYRLENEFSNLQEAVINIIREKLFVKEGDRYNASR